MLLVEMQWFYFEFVQNLGATKIVKVTDNTVSKTQHQLIVYRTL